MNSFVSVIIPAHNAEKFILDTLLSVAAQTHSSFELIVVDDGSKDATSEIVRCFQDQRIRLFRTKGIGAAAARNVGLAEAHGEFIQFLDADDLLSPDKLALQLSALRQNNELLASCAWLPFTDRIDDALEFSEPVWTTEDPIAWQQQSMCGLGMMQTGCWLTHKSLIEKAGPWNESLTLHDDGEFFTRVMLAAGRQVFVADCRVYYRRVPGSLSRQRGAKAIESAFEVCRLRTELLLLTKNSDASSIAAATLWAQFAYEFSGSEPALVNSALRQIKLLGHSPKNIIGGPKFRIVQQWLGWTWAMSVRRFSGQ